MIVLGKWEQPSSPAVEQSTSSLSYSSSSITLHCCTVCTKVYVQYIDERELVVWISTTPAGLAGGVVWFCHTSGEATSEGKIIPPQPQDQQKWLKSIQPRARINVLHSLIVLGTTYETGCMEAYIFFLTWYLPWFIIYILNYGYV